MAEKSLSTKLAKETKSINKSKFNFRNKRVLVFGLGLLGGGVATTNWLIKHGARVTVTDLKSEDYLEPSLRQLHGKPKLNLNGHDKKDIEGNDIIVFNPDVSVNNPFVKYARKLGKQIENEATIFYKLCRCPIIAVTGTRGKTTTANWIGHFLNKSRRGAVVTGNSYDQPMLKTLDQYHLSPYSRELENKNRSMRNKGGNISNVVNEIPSYHLEYWGRSIPPPEIAVITNLYRDHINRHGTMRDYALAKANIFKGQVGNQNLILNYDNKWTKFFLNQKPCAQVWFFSTKLLSAKVSGIFYKNRVAYLNLPDILSNYDRTYVEYRKNKKSGGKRSLRPVLDLGEFEKKWGSHNLENLLASSLAANLAGVPWGEIQKAIESLPQVPFRQEVVFENNRLKIINDTTATSPDGGIAAIERFGGPGTVLIAGGTDPALMHKGGASRGLDFRKWARAVKKRIKPENLVLLEGSATRQMARELRIKNHELRMKKTLKECISEATKRAGKYSKSVVLFSPAAKSFEKFQNEYDRGRQFNGLVRKVVKIWKGGRVV